MILTIMWIFALLISTMMYAMSWVIEIELNKLQADPVEAVDYTKLYNISVGYVVSLVIFTLAAMIAMGFYIKQGDIYASSVFAYVGLIVIGGFGIAFSSILINIMNNKDNDENKKVLRLERVAENGLGLSSVLVGIMLGVAYGKLAFTDSIKSTVSKLSGKLPPGI